MVSFAQVGEKCFGREQYASYHGNQTFFDGLLKKHCKNYVSKQIKVTSWNGYHINITIKIMCTKYVHLGKKLQFTIIRNLLKLFSFITQKDISICTFRQIYRHVLIIGEIHVVIVWYEWHIQLLFLRKTEEEWAHYLHLQKCCSWKYCFNSGMENLSTKMIPNLLCHPNNYKKAFYTLGNCQLFYLISTKKLLL